MESSEADLTLDIGFGDDILVVDDSPANLLAISTALAPLQRNVVQASSGVEALARLLDQDFALILLDMSMPGMTGIETARLIRSRERSRGTPIIFVTGRSWDDEAIDEAYEVGGFDFLIKPVRPEVLRAKAQVFLKLQERTRALERREQELRESQARLLHHELQEQRKRFDSELLESHVQQLADVERTREEFVAILGHELRNPLHALQTAFEVLRQHPDAERTERVFSLIDRRFLHVTRLVNGLLDVARFTSGHFQLSAELVDIGEIIRQAYDDCRAIIDERQHEVILELDDPAVVNGDHVRLLQVVTSLVDNAARYTDRGGRIVVTATVHAGEVRVTVRDNGRGIAADSLPKIFNMFVRKRSASDGAPGLGLGLGLAKRLIELHDGAVRATSAGPGQGSVFEIRLPLAPQELELNALSDVARPTIEMVPLEL